MSHTIIAVHCSRYCSARLRRLFRSLRFLHGKGKYQRKSLEPNTVTDVRHLHIPLFSAERAWAYAMELKQAISEAGSAAAAQAAFARKRAHLLRRLARAARWADGFSRLCAARADSKTALEAEVGRGAGEREEGRVRGWGVKRRGGRAGVGGKGGCPNVRVRGGWIERAP
ncbi:unnamed protein product [Closterium sp. Naga37s-1]|nr:unnamed protein product [Closterium sp. Naga37s-1]